MLLTRWNPLPPPSFWAPDQTCQESFFDQVEKMHELRQTVEVTLDQGWYSEKEMKDDLGWASLEPQKSQKNALCKIVFALIDKQASVPPRAKIAGAKKKCEQSADLVRFLGNTAPQHRHAVTFCRAHPEVESVRPDRGILDHS